MAARKKAGRKETRRERSARNKREWAEGRKTIPLSSTNDDFLLPPCPWQPGDGPTAAVVDIMLEAIAVHAASLQSIHRKDPTYPSAATFCMWVADDPHLAERYARARDSRADVMAEEAGIVAAGAHRPARQRDKAGAVMRDKLHADQIRWHLSKMSARYGDKVKVEHEGAVKHEVQLDLSKLSEQQLEQALELAKQVAPEDEA